MPEHMMQYGVFYAILVSLNFILWALGWYTENTVGAFHPPCLYGWPSDQSPLLSILQTTSGAYFSLCSRQLLSIDQHWNKTHAYESLRIATNYLKSLSHTHRGTGGNHLPSSPTLETIYSRSFLVVFGNQSYISNSVWTIWRYIYLIFVGTSGGWKSSDSIHICWTTNLVQPHPGYPQFFASLPLYFTSQLTKHELRDSWTP